MHFAVDDSSTIDPQVLTELVAQLKSADTKREAARKLAIVSPASLEDLLLTFKDDKVLKEFAPLALSRLKTNRSMAALAQLMVKADPGSSEALDTT